MGRYDEFSLMLIGYCFYNECKLVWTILEFYLFLSPVTMRWCVWRVACLRFLFETDFRANPAYGSDAACGEHLLLQISEYCHAEFGIVETWLRSFGSGIWLVCWFWGFGFSLVWYWFWDYLVMVMVLIWFQDIFVWKIFWFSFGKGLARLVALVPLFFENYTGKCVNIINYFN